MQTNQCIHCNEHKVRPFISRETCDITLSSWLNVQKLLYGIVFHTIAVLEAVDILQCEKEPTLCYAFLPHPKL